MFQRSGPSISRISTHLTELNALLTSKATKTQVSLVLWLPCYALPSISEASFMAPIVDRPFLKQCWLCDRFPVRETAARSLALRSFFSTFLALSSIQSGLYDEEVMGGPLALSKRTSLFTLHRCPETPASRQTLNMFRRRYGRSFAIVPLTSVGIPSGPGAFRVPVDWTVVFGSCTVEVVISSSTEITPSFLPGWSGKRDVTILSIISESRGGSGICLLSRFMTIWYPSPHVSRTTSFVSSNQCLYCLASIAILRLWVRSLKGPHGQVVPSPSRHTPIDCNTSIGRQTNLKLNVLMVTAAELLLDSPLMNVWRTSGCSWSFAAGIIHPPIQSLRVEVRKISGTTSFEQACSSPSYPGWWPPLWPLLIAHSLFACYTPTWARGMVKWCIAAY